MVELEQLDWASRYAVGEREFTGVELRGYLRSPVILNGYCRIGNFIVVPVMHMRIVSLLFWMSFGAITGLAIGAIITFIYPVTRRSAQARFWIMYMAACGGVIGSIAGYIGSEYLYNPPFESSFGGNLRIVFVYLSYLVVGTLLGAILSGIWGLKYYLSRHSLR